MSKLIDKINSRITSSDNIFLLNSKKSDLSEINFIEFSSGYFIRKIAFVDSGFQEISNEFYLVRVNVSIWSENRKIEELHCEFFLDIKTMEYELFKEDEFSLTCVKNITKDIAESTESSAISFLLSKLSAGDIIVRDGSFDSEIFDEVISDSISKNILLMAISKSTDIKNNVGLSLTNYLYNFSKNKCPNNMWFVKVFDFDNRIVLVSKLNKNSNFCFRIDMIKQSGLDIKHPLEIISCNCIDPIFLGYPYGLIDVDMNARVSNEDIEFYKTKFFLEQGFGNMSGSVHNILDNLRF